MNTCLVCCQGCTPAVCPQRQCSCNVLHCRHIRVFIFYVLAVSFATFLCLSTEFNITCLHSRALLILTTVRELGAKNTNKFLLFCFRRTHSKLCWLRTVNCLLWRWTTTSLSGRGRDGWWYVAHNAFSLLSTSCPSIQCANVPCMYRLWQAEWDGCISSTLHTLKPLLGYSNLSGLSRQYVIILKNLRIGHTRLTHLYHLNRIDPPRYPYCDCTFAVKHVFLDCDNCNTIRQRYLNALAWQYFSTQQRPHYSWFY